MKIAAIFIMLLILAGCCSPARIKIPEEPKYKQFNVYPLEDGVCLEDADAAILVGNVKAMKDYQDELRRLLRDLQAGR